MRVTILGTGNVGQTLAEKFIAKGHHVTLGTRNVEETSNREKFKEWQTSNSTVVIEEMNKAVSSGEIVINALNGAATLPVFAAIEANNLNNKIVIDVANPLDFSKGFPPTLSEGLINNNSLGEALQVLIPNARVVKTLNTMWCGLMLNPTMINEGNHINFMCGNDEDAKSKVVALLNEFGWNNENILDLGDITNARGTEAYLLLWTRVYAATQNGAFNLQIVK
jgi:8-hydroxy-5-deazaflavin:NADPH oxidoreductase